MKMKMLALVLLAFVTLLVNGCGAEKLETIVIVTPTMAGQGPFTMGTRGTSAQLNAIGIYGSKNEFNITNQVAWTSSAPTLLTVNTVGLITTTANCTTPGTLVTITAAKDGISQFVNVMANCLQ